MLKNVVQDVMPPTKRSIRDIPLSNKKKSISKKDETRDISKGIGGIRPPQKKSKTKWWFITIVILALATFLFSYVFSGATVTLVPKQETVEFNTQLTAVKGDIKSDIEGVPFTIIQINSAGSRTTSNVNEKDVDIKASGQIIVFNDYDSSKQRLIKNTRFETPEGLIYRISKSATVPGRTIENGKIIPGSVEVTVYADVPGVNYNIGLTDFTIPGFKGTDRFGKFYARSKTAMENGFSGVMKIVDDIELEKMRADIHIDLEKELKEDVYTQTPEGFVLYQDGFFIEYDSKPNLDLGDSVQVIEEGVLTAIAFDKAELSNYIGKTILLDINESSVEVLNLEELNFKILERDDINIDEIQSFDFNLKGISNFSWTFDEEKMKEEFAGQSKKNTNAILGNYAGIKEAEVVISPFWKRNFPTNYDRIKIERVLEITN